VPPSDYHSGLLNLACSPHLEERRKRNHLYLEVTFLDGRVIYLRSSVDHLSPASAAEYEKSTALFLGEPTVVVMDPSQLGGSGSLHFHESNRIWTDGDVRIKLSKWWHDDCASDSLIAIEMTIWPMYLNMSEANTSLKTPFERRRLVDDCLRTWGDSSAPPRVTKPLPDSLGGLRLGMKPWQVREAIPGIGLETISQSLISGHFQKSDRSGCRVRFWDGDLYEIKCSKVHRGVDWTKRSHTRTALWYSHSVLERLLDRVVRSLGRVWYLRLGMGVGPLD
jgi:hypothetical protein